MTEEQIVLKALKEYMDNQFVASWLKRHSVMKTPANPQEGDTTMIFGRPFTYSGGKWVPDDKKKVDKPRSGKRNSDEIKKILKDEGPKALLKLSKNELNRFLKDNGAFDKSVDSYLKKLVLANHILDKKGLGTFPDAPKKEEKEKKVAPPKSFKHKAYSSDNMKAEIRTGAGLSTVSMADAIEHMKKNPRFSGKLEENGVGGHWGSAKKNNRIAREVAATSSKKFSPLTHAGTKIGKDEEHNPLKPNVLLHAIQMRNYAQKQVKKFSREKHPNIYRGMSLSKKEIDKIVSGKSKDIALTGATAFSFYEDIADQYSSSSWTQGFGRNKVPVKIVLKRDDNVDNSLGMWHHKNKAHNEPAFETLSGLSNIKIDKIDMGKIKSVQELDGEIDDKLKKLEGMDRHNTVKGLSHFKENRKEIQDVAKVLKYTGDTYLKKMYTANLLHNYQVSSKLGQSFKDYAEEVFSRSSHSYPNYMKKVAEKVSDLKSPLMSSFMQRGKDAEDSKKKATEVKDFFGAMTYGVNYFEKGRPDKITIHASPGE